MSINYDVLFRHVGALVGRGNNLASIGTTTLPADLSTIIQAFGTANTGTSNAQLSVSGLAPDYAGLMEAVTSLRNTVYGYADAALTDFDTVISQLAGASSQDVTTTLGLLYQDMLDNGQTVQSSAVTIGALTAASGNVGNGTVLLDGYLDGFQPGLQGGFQTIRYAGVKSELAPPSLLHAFSCTSDSYGGGASGSESFSWDDSVDFGAFPSFPEGAGSGPGLTANGGSDNVPNGNFESWSGAGRPASWSVSGTVFKDSSVLYRGTASLGVPAQGGAVTLSSPLPPGSLDPLRRYCVTARLLRTGAAPSGSVSLDFSGTGYAPRPGESFSTALSAIGTSWTLVKFWVTVPGNVPDDFAFVLSFPGGVPPGCVMHVDDLFCTPVTYFAGVNATACCGKIPFAVGDRFYATVTNAEAIFQSFARQKYKMQFNSKPSSGPTSYALLLPFTLFTAATGGPTIPDVYAA